jgi:hypothetical protein
MWTRFVRQAIDGHRTLPVALRHASIVPAAAGDSYSEGRPARRSRVTIARALVAASLLPFELGGVGANAAPVPSCTMHLSVLLTPDVPNPFDRGFLSSLIGNHPHYQLIARSPDNGSNLDVLLNGPGPNYRCQMVIDAMRKDARVLSIDVQPEPSQ